MTGIELPLGLGLLLTYLVLGIGISCSYYLGMTRHGNPLTARDMLWIALCWPAHIVNVLFR